MIIMQIEPSDHSKIDDDLEEVDPEINSDDNDDKKNKKEKKEKKKEKII